MTRPRNGLTVAVYENELFAIGGAFSSEVERYNETENKWAQIVMLNNASVRHHATFAIIKSS